MVANSCLRYASQSFIMAVALRAGMPSAAGGIQRVLPNQRDLESLCFVGKLKRKIAPRGEFSIAHNLPPWASMIERLIIIVADSDRRSRACAMIGTLATISSRCRCCNAMRLFGERVGC